MTYQTNRPRRERKATGLSPDATKAQIECDYAIAPMDRLALEMDASGELIRSAGIGHTGNGDTLRTGNGAHERVHPPG
jgi:hypothetical protein